MWSAAVLAASLGLGRAQESEFAQGSFFEASELSSLQSENLALLGKVWGFLKYHHPRVTGGELAWDDELFRALPEVLDAPDRAAGRAAIGAWAAQLGEPRPSVPAAEPLSDAALAPDLDWLADEALLGPELAAFLARVHAHRPAAAEQHYVTFAPNVGNALFERELDYAHLREPDAGYRLLALFRFWNVVEYWFPYRDVIGADWDAVLREFVPRLAGAGGPGAYERELLALIARVHDTHANLWSSLGARPPGGTALVPAVVRFVDGRAVVAAHCLPPGATSGLQRGDVLLAVGGEPVADLVARWTPYYAASNEPTRLRDIGRELLRGPPGPVALRIERDGQALELVEPRLPEEQLGPERGQTHDRPGETFALLSPEVAYLKLSTLRAAEVEDLLARAAGTRGLVLDLRSYPREFVVFALGQHLVAEHVPFAFFSKPTAANPGGFEWFGPFGLMPQAPRYEGQVVILLDEISQSQAEYTAMALRQAPGARVIGSTTAGADGNVSPLSLPGGRRTMISGLGVFTPERGPTQRVGIRPDLEVRPTLAGIRAGRDEPLEAAVRVILGPAASEADVRRIAAHGR